MRKGRMEREKKRRKTEENENVEREREFIPRFGKKTKQIVNRGIGPLSLKIIKRCCGVALLPFSLA